MKRKIILTGVAVSLILVIIFFWKTIFNLEKSLDEGGDAVYNYYLLDNDFRKLSSLDFKDFFQTGMFYPHKNTLAWGNTHLGLSILGLPVYSLTQNVIISSNFILLLVFFLNFLTMYILSFYLTKNISASLMTGVIYTYNPYVISHTPNHFEMLTLFWIPLIFLSIEKLLKKISLKWSLLLSLFLIGQLTSALYYTIFLSIILPIYLIARIFLEKIPFKRFLSFKILLALLLLLIFSVFYIKPFIEVKNQYHVQRDVEVINALSAKPTDFFFTTPKNMLYGWMVDNQFFKSLRDPYIAVHYTEHSLFFGFVVHGLFIYGLLFFIKKKFDPSDIKKVTALVVILIISFILSFGPYYQLGNTQVPLPYMFFYKFIPFTDTIRALSRFNVVVIFSIALISAYVLSKKSKLLIFSLIILILVEYFSLMPNPKSVNKEVSDFYTKLGQDKEINAILELPIANNLPEFSPQSRGLIVDAIYLLYGTYHHKNLIHGWNAFIPDDVVALGNRLTINFPTLEKIKDLKNMGVDIIIIHLDEYNDLKIGIGLVKKLKSLGLEEIYSSNKIYAFKI